MHKQKLPLLPSGSTSIKSLNLKTVEERRNYNVTIHELFVTPKEVLFKLDRDSLHAAFSQTNSHRVEMSTLMFLLLKEQGTAPVGTKSMNVYKVGFLQHTMELVISQGYFWLKQSYQWTLALLYNCNQKSSGNLNCAVVFSQQVICEASLPLGVHISQ